MTKEIVKKEYIIIYYLLIIYFNSKLKLLITIIKFY